MDTTDRTVHWAGYLLILVVVAVLYLPGVDSAYFADDFQFVFSNPAEQSAGCLTKLYQPNTFYRPLQTCFLLHVQAAVGLSTIPIHVVQMLIHAFTSCLICWAVFRMSSKRSAALIAGVAMAAGQANVLAVVNNDTLSQLCGTMFGVAALVVFTAAFDRRAALAGWRRACCFVSGLACLLLSLLSKESSLSFSVLSVGAVLFAPAIGRRPLRRAIDAFAAAVPIAIVTLAYLAFRENLHAWPATFGPGMYSFRFGSNVPFNVAALGLSAWLPLSSVDLYSAYALGRFPLVGGYVVASATWVAVATWGLANGDHLRGAALLCVAAIIAMFPMAAMNHVSELYSYNSMPFVAALIGLGMGALLDGQKSRRIPRRAVVALLLVVGASHGLASHSKVRMMRENGRRAWELLPAVVGSARSAPQGATLALVNPAPLVPPYSAFHLNGFDLIFDAGPWIRQAAQRPDLIVTVIDRDRAATLPGDAIRLTIDAGRVVPLPPR